MAGHLISACPAPTARALSPERFALAVPGELVSHVPYSTRSVQNSAIPQVEISTHLLQNPAHGLRIDPMSALQQFFDAERTRRGWSMRETAKRSQISLSKAYAIVNGDDNVEFETFENI